MRIAIYGAGAIGGHLAVRLACAGHDVSVVARGPTLKAIVAHGLRLETGTGTLEAHPAATDDPSHLGPQDLVVVAVKSTGLTQVALGLDALVDGDTSVVFAQNGMPWWYPLGLPRAHGPVPDLPIFALRDAFLAVLRVDQVVPAVLYTANEVIAPGVVRNNSPQRNAIELASLTTDAASRVDRLRAVFDAAAIESPIVEDIRAAVWLKLIANTCASSLGVATGSPGAIATDPAIRRTFLRIADECLSVAAALGFDLAGRLDLTRWTERPQHHRSSLLQDFDRARPMELDAIVLAPLAFARATGTPTPTLDAVASIVRRLAIDRGCYVDPDRVPAIDAPDGR